MKKIPILLSLNLSLLNLKLQNLNQFTVGKIEL
jgi:hypothetical protein